MKNITCYAQGDARWDKIRLGYSRSTIGGYGCLVSSAASYFTDIGIQIAGHAPDPGTLNRWLARNGGFVSGNLFVFNAPSKLGVQLIDYIDCSRVPAPLEKIQAAFGAGYGVIAEVDFWPGSGMNQHWVRLVHGDEQDMLVMDPWIGQLYWLMSRYASPDWGTTARAIFRLAIYAPADAAAASFSALQVKEEERITQEHLYRRGGRRGFLGFLKNLLLN